MILFSQNTAATANNDVSVFENNGKLIPSNETDSRLDRIAEGFKYFVKRDCLRNELVEDVDRIAPNIHTRSLLEFIKKISENCDDGHPVYAKQFQTHSSKQPSPIDALTWMIARSAAGICLSAANAISRRETKVAYALCRPPGHHAGRNFFGGYCYLNNAAIAAYHLQVDHGLQVAVLDIDYHAGDGTLDCLGPFSEIPCASLHRSTDEAFPYSLEAITRNDVQLSVNLRGQIDEAVYLANLQQVIEQLSQRKLDVLIVSIGYDIIDGDPHGGWHLKPEIFRLIGEMLAGTSLPILLIQEGGYLERDLSQCASALETGLLNGKEHS